MHRARSLSSSQVSSWFGAGPINVPSRHFPGVVIPLDGTSHQGLFYYNGTAAYSQGFSNPHSGGQVNVSASSAGGGSVANLIDRTTADFVTGDVASSWLKFDIAYGSTTRRFYATYIDVRQRQGPSSLFKAFKVEGSLDNASWTEIGSITGIAETSGLWTTLALNPAQNWRYIRITQTGTNWWGTNYFYVDEVEIYGILTPY